MSSVELTRVSIALVAGQVRVSRLCPVCRTENTVVLPGRYRPSVRAWRSGAAVEYVFPEFSVEMLESLRTGTHPQCATTEGSP